MPLSNEPTAEHDTVRSRSGKASSEWSRHTGFAALVLAGVCGWVIWRFGGFDFFRTGLFSGRQQSVVDTFAAVDHPFHATRAATLLQSVQEGDLLRWVGHHQGGYPVEFYPLGVAWFEVVLWFAALGSVPIIAIHKLAVLLIFVMPAIGFWVLARGDRLDPWLPMLATVLHVTIPGGVWTNGGWTRGGYEELVRWGLVTNVAGATVALIACAALARAVIKGQGGWGTVAAVMIAVAVYTNPRSLLAIMIAAAAIAVTAFISRRDDAALSAPVIGRRILLVGITSALLAALVLVPLIRYRDLYFFVRYERYASFSEYWTNTLTAVSPPVFIATLGGIVIAIGVRRFPVARAFSLALLGYMLLIGVLSANDALIEQLEAPRLMPFQRLLMIYLAAFAISQALEALVRFFRIGRRGAVTGGLTGAVAVIVLVLLWGSVWAPPEDYRTLDADTTADGTFLEVPGAALQSEFLAFEAAVRVADSARPTGTAILVVGDREGWWHEQLWGPAWSDAPFFYDDWLWYWHTHHEGPYNYRQGHSYPDPAQTFNPAYLQTHAIGAVVVTDMDVSAGAVNPRKAANGDPDLEQTATVGEWDIYTVSDPAPLISNGSESPTSVFVEDTRLAAVFGGAAGEVTIRRNWFPRWEAFADGEQVEVQRTGNGYMQIVVPEGTMTVELRYETTFADWSARMAAIAGLGVAGLLPSVWGPPPSQRFRSIRDHSSEGSPSPSRNRSPKADTAHRILPRPSGTGLSRPRVRALVNNASTNASGTLRVIAASRDWLPGLNPAPSFLTWRRKRRRPSSRGEEVGEAGCMGVP